MTHHQLIRNDRIQVDGFITGKVIRHREGRVWFLQDDDGEAYQVREERVVLVHSQVDTAAAEAREIQVRADYRDAWRFQGNPDGDPGADPLSDGTW